MRAALIQIGNSKGIRIPKPILEQCGIEDEVDLQVEERRLIVRSIRPARAGWSEAFAAMSRRGDDLLIDEEVVSPHAG